MTDSILILMLFSNNFFRQGGLFKDKRLSQCDRMHWRNTDTNTGSSQKSSGLCEPQKISQYQCSGMVCFNVWILGIFISYKIKILLFLKMTTFKKIEISYFVLIDYFIYPTTHFLYNIVILYIDIYINVCILVRPVVHHRAPQVKLIHWKRWCSKNQ